MHEVIIADTSCLITLANAGELDLLRQVYGEVAITPEIAGEYGAALPEWLIVKAAQDRSRVRLLGLQIDQGEASALALAIEFPGCTVILDDLKARKLASRLDIKHTGTLGIIVKAKLQGLIPNIQPVLARMKAVGFRISPELEAATIKLARELPPRID